MTKERPILFSAPMVRALLARRKTQTRRILRDQPQEKHETSDATSWLVRGFVERGHGVFEYSMGEQEAFPCPHGQPGDLLWCKETWQASDLVIKHRMREDRNNIWFRSTDEPPPHVRKWRPSIFMPRWASRITLDITTVRVERLQGISAADAIAEGVEELSHGWKDYLGRDLQHGDPIISFLSLWESIHGPGSWEENPWVWVLEFREV